jgi:hypothetical protein
MRHLIYSIRYSVVQINSSLLTATLHSSVTTTLVYTTQNIQSLSWRYNRVRLYFLSRLWCLTPLILNLGTRWRWVVNFTSGPLDPPVPTEYWAVWVSKRVWTFWRREEFVAQTGIRTSHRPACGVVAIPTAHASSFLGQEWKASCGNTLL